MLWSPDVRCGVLCFHVVWLVWLVNGVLVAWQVGLFGSLGYLLGV